MNRMLIILFSTNVIFFLLGSVSFTEPPPIDLDIRIELLERVEIGAGARPEVVATKDRVFIVYLDTAKEIGPAFSVKIYDKDMNKEIAYRILVSASEKYGRPTDIRVASDENYLYAFYEQTDGYLSNLFGAKYKLDDYFERIAYTQEPIVTAPAWTKEKVGDEVPNDPITLLGPDSVFVITRIYQESPSVGNPTIYRLREFSTDLKRNISQFDLDLSKLAGAEGNARQASAYYYDEYYYMLVPTTSRNGSYAENMATPSDLLLVQFDKNWELVKYNNLSQDHDDIETFVLGFEIYNDLFFITYKQGMPFVCPLNVYDQNFNPILSEIIKEAIKGESLRSALDVRDDRIYIGLSAGQGPSPPGMDQSPVSQGILFKERQNMRQGRSLSQEQVFSIDKSDIGTTGAATAEVYIYKIDW
jgi:hypothetical protein